MNSTTPEPPRGPQYKLVVSKSMDRTNPIPLEGEVLTENVYIYLTPVTNVQSVRFILDDDLGTSNESSAPFDFAGTQEDYTATAWDTTQVKNDWHKISAVLTFSDFSTETVTAQFETLNERFNDEVDYNLMLSYNADRSDAWPLSMQNVSASQELFIFIWPETGVQRAFFFFDGEMAQKENKAPYDMGGTQDGHVLAKPWKPIEGYDVGVAHVVEAVLKLEDGAERVVTASFAFSE